MMGSFFLSPFIFSVIFHIFWRFKKENDDDDTIFPPSFFLQLFIPAKSHLATSFLSYSLSYSCTSMVSFFFTLYNYIFKASTKFFTLIVWNFFILNLLYMLYYHNLLLKKRKISKFWYISINLMLSNFFSSSNWYYLTSSLFFLWKMR